MEKKEQKKFNIYLKAGIWGMLAEILVRAISFLATPIFSRILPMDVYGEVKTFESWLNILSPILALGLFVSSQMGNLGYYFAGIQDIGYGIMPAFVVGGILYILSVVTTSVAAFLEK